MARIRVLKVNGHGSSVKPKVAFFHKDNFDNYTTSKNGKYNVIVIGRKQKDSFLDNQLKAFSDKIRLHKTRASRYS